jgi:hypothetical protein
MRSIFRKSAIGLFALYSILLLAPESASAQMTCQTTDGATCVVNRIPSGVTGEINRHGSCARVTNNSGFPMAVFHRTSPEWLSTATGSFLRRVPPAVSVQPCAPDTTPNSFTIMNGLVCAAWDGTNAGPRSLTSTSSAATPTGYDTISTASISTTGIGTSTLSVNNGPWVTSASISPGQSIRIRTQVTVPNTVATYDMTAHLTIGGLTVNRPVRFKIFGTTGSCP